MAPLPIQTGKIFEKILKKQFYIICLVLFISGCSSTTKESNLSPKNADNETQTEIGYSFGMLHSSSIDQYQTYYKVDNTNNKFVPEIMIDNQIDKSYTYRIFALKNYNQQSVGFENEEKPYIDIKLQPFEKKKFNITLDVDKGANDITVICIRNPDHVLTKDQYVPPEGVYALRRAVVVNGPASFENTHRQFKNEPVYEKKTTNDNSKIAPHVLLDGDDELRTIIPSSYTGKLNLRMGNEKPKTKYAFFSIVGDKILTLKNPFIEVQEPGNINLDLIDLPLNKNQINKNLIIGVIENPFILDSEQIASSDNRFVNVITLK